MATRFGNLGVVFDGPHATPARRTEGPYFLNISSLDSGRLDLRASDHVDEADFKKWTRRVIPQEGDLLFSYETRLGQAALMPGGVRACLGRRMALLRPDRAVVDPRFLLYFYLSPAFQGLIAERAIHGATVDRIPLSLMEEWPVGIPPLPIQRAIAEVLGALDDKIAANQTVAIAADAVAQVRFEVLCARGDGEVSLSSLVSTQYGLTTSPVQGGGPKLARVTDINKHPWIDWSRAPSCDVGPGDQAKYGLAVEDILVARMADPGKVGIVDEFAPEAVFASYLVRLRPGPLLEPLVLYYFLRSPAYVDYCQSARQGSVQSNMNARVIVAANIPTIDRQLQYQFASDARMLRRRMSAALAESRHLAELRDTLLPHLMSGRLTVREAEKQVEAAL
jgi:type I restriction enzyme S subunit